MEERAKALDRVIFVGGLPDSRPNDGIHGPPDIRLDLLVEADSASETRPSTLLRWEGKSFEILREGALAASTVTAFLEEVE